MIWERMVHLGLDVPGLGRAGVLAASCSGVPDMVGLVEGESAAERRTAHRSGSASLSRWAEQRVQVVRGDPVARLLLGDVDRPLGQVRTVASRGSIADHALNRGKI
jgi:hypothetical protein